jgi:hypothetical protein
MGWSYDAKTDEFVDDHGVRRSRNGVMGCRLGEDPAPLSHGFTAVGIDGGLSGAIAVYRNGHYAVHPMPTITEVKGHGRRATRKRHYDVSLMPLFVREANIVFLERARSTPRDGHASAFHTGYGFGLWVGILESLRKTSLIIEVGVWQPRMLDRIAQKADTKAASIAAVKARHPEIVLRATPQCRTDHDGMADAVNILDYGLQFILKQKEA